MDHQKIYNSIVETAKTKNRVKLKKNQKGYVYYEKHHIIPKCMNGSDDEINLVLLTAKEHYLCHKLLTYIYSNYKIALAFFRMTFDKQGKHKISSRDYQYAKEILSSQMSGKKLSPEHREKIGKSIKGKMKGIPKSEQAKKNMSKSRIKFLSENTNPLIGRKRPEFGKNQIGEKNPMFGKHLSESAKETLRKFWTGKPRIFEQITCDHCHKIVNPGNYKRWHGDNCKFKN